MVQNILSQKANRRTYHYCQGRIANELGSDSSQAIAQYGSQLLAQQFRKEEMCTYSLLIVDQQRTILHRADPQRPRQPLVYTPYGYRSQHAGWLGFNGERPDSMTHHYLLGNGRRGFSPVLMRFNSPDSISPFGSGGLNSYGYCLQDPINYQDPSGRFRVARFISNLFGRVTGNRRYNVPKKGVFPSIHANVTPVVVAPIRPFGQKNGAGKIFVKKVNENQVVMNVTTGRTETAGYDFLGYHGSSEGHKQSLEAGLDIKYNTMQRYGPGFYYSPNPETAMGYARSEGGSQGYVYGVYGKSSKLKGHINQYLGGDYRVIREGGFENVLVRDFIQYPIDRSALEVRR